MPVRFHDGANGNLRDLRAARHDDDALAVNLLHCSSRIGAAQHRKLAEVGEHPFPGGGFDFEIDAGTERGVLDDGAGADVAAVFGNHACKAVENAGAGVGIDEKAVSIHIHTGAMIAV